jgi:hypothetical protein
MSGKIVRTRACQGARGASVSDVASSVMSDPGHFGRRVAAPHHARVSPRA